MKVDLLFLAHNRLEFTRKSWSALLLNTDWSLVRALWVYDDASTDGTQECLAAFTRGMTSPLIFFIPGKLGGPVAVMNSVIQRIAPNSILAKIDNDVMLPPRWLNESLGVMLANPGLDLLGIEAHSEVVPGDCPTRGAQAAPYIGGIGLMRTRAFQTFPEPQGRFGFTAWQDQHPEVEKAWLTPSLPVCLLDRVPFEPWSSLSAEYVKKGWQRPWEPYDQKSSALWEWWAQPYAAHSALEHKP